MLTQYKNIETILTSKRPISADRLAKKDLSLLKYAKAGRVIFNPSITGQPDTVTEFHVYAGETWVTGNHRIDVAKSNLTTITDSVTGTSRKLLAPPVEINLYKLFSDLELTRGRYQVVFNFFKNVIGSYNEQHLKIDEISPDRTELRLKAIDNRNSEWLKQITEFIKTVNQTTETGYYRPFLLNFSRNKTALFINSVVIGDFVYVKLYEPLDESIEENFKCWIVEELKRPFIDNVSIQPRVSTEESFNRLAGPNWEASYDYNVSSETGLKNWNDLLGSSLQTSQQIIDAYFSGSLQGVQLNIDYSDFNNFVFYSTATERVKNFLYKIQLLEYYNSQVVTISQVSGSIAQANAAEYQTNITNLIGGFDGFEKFLYYESSSVLYTNPYPHPNPNVEFITGSYITPYPKTNSIRPYSLYSFTSSIVETWSQQLLESADTYDRFNLNTLQKAIPEYIRLDQQNEELDTFVAMLGHHYDILYTYINHMNKIHSREENPKLGMPNELLFSVAKQFGWNLTDGNQYQDLWQYVLGTDETGTLLTGSNSVGEPSVPGRDMTYHVWRRIVNNLPLLLKSKGTKRSIKALLSCYGIPQSIISINEYGGPRIDRTPVYEKLNFDYALDLIGNSSGTVTIPFSQAINSIELRFRTDNVLTNPTIPTTMNLLRVGSNIITIEFTRGTLGNLQINGTPTADFECFNGDWVNVLLRTTGSNLELIAKKSKYGKIISTVSASAAASISVPDSVILGGSAGGSRLVGQLQELRLWSSSLQDDAFINHTKAPAAYDANNDTYDELVFRLPLTQKINHTLTSSLSGVEPNPSGISASFAGWSSATPYDSIEETYYYDAISLGTGTFDDNKIRLEDNELIGTLDVKARAERSQYDKAPLDSNRLGVYFSPQTMIDEDIISHFGFLELDSFIGDPGDARKKSYPALIQKAQDYWKKYETKNDINSYLKIFSLFDLSFFKQLQQLLPARANKITGVVIQPNILERNKDSMLPKVVREDATLDSQIIVDDFTLQGSYNDYSGAIQGRIVTVDAQDDDQLQGFLTRSSAVKYGGTKYSYTYAVLSGSTYITGTSPYWRSEGVLPYISSSTVSATRRTKVAIPAYEVDRATTGTLGVTFVPVNYTYNNGVNGIGATLTRTSTGLELGLPTASAIGDIILVKNGAYISGIPQQYVNGIYEVLVPDGISTQLTLRRVRFSDESAELFPQQVLDKSTNTIYVQRTSNPIVGTSNIVYTTTTSLETYTYTETQYQDFISKGVENHRYNGCKMTSAGFNISSLDTIDGGPVVETRESNPNQLIYQAPNQNGNFRLSSQS